MLLADALIQVAGKNATKPAVSYLGKEINYTLLRQMIGRLSYLYQHEIGHGARVGFLTSNSPAVITTLFALTNTKSVVIPLDPTATFEQLADWCKKTHVTHLAITSDLQSLARQFLDAERLHYPIIEIEKKRGGEYDTSYTPPPDQIPKDTDIILVLRTQGTTDKPKYVNITHRQLHQAAVCLRKPYHITPADKILTTLNWYHPFPLVHGMLFPLFVGATCVIHYGLENLEFLNFLYQTRVNYLITTSKLCHNLVMICKEEKRTGLPPLKGIVTGFGPASLSLRKIFELLKVHLSQCYGQTENVWTISMEDLQAPKLEEHMIGVGLAGFEYKVVDESGDLIEGSGARIGRLALTCQSIMSGYLMDNPELAKKATKEALRGTWLYTGDLAQLDGEGDDLKITFFGRRTDAVYDEKFGKYHLPYAMEPLLKKITGIQDSAGFATKNMLGKPMLACAVVKAEKSTITEQLIRQELTSLPEELKPKAVFFTDVILKDLSGNPIRYKLGRQFSGLAG